MALGTPRQIPPLGPSLDISRYNPFDRGGGGGDTDRFEGFANAAAAYRPTSDFYNNYGQSVPDSAHISNTDYILTPYQQAVQNWHEGTTGLNELDYNNRLSQISAQRNAASAGYQSAVSAANRGYGVAKKGHGLDIRGINQDLRFGNQLRAEEKYRNVYIARKRSRSDFGQAQRTFLSGIKDAFEQKDFARRGHSGAQEDIRAGYRSGVRDVISDAAGRGARTAGGTIARGQELGGARARGLEKAQLDFDSAMSGIRSAERRNASAFTHAKEQYGLDQKTFDSLEKTYGIQAAQAVAQAKLAKDRARLALESANVSRQNAVSQAAAQRSQALAGLTGATGQAFTDYGRAQIAAQQQFYAAAGKPRY